MYSEILTTTWPLCDFSCTRWKSWHQRFIFLSHLSEYKISWHVCHCWSRFLRGLCQVSPFELKHGKLLMQQENCVCLSVQEKKTDKHKTPLLLQGPVQLSRSPNLCNPLSSRRSVRMTEPILFTTARQWHGGSLASRPRINTPALWEERERGHETE